MVSSVALLLVANQTSTWQLAIVAHFVLVSVESEVEVVDFSAEYPLLLTFLNLVCPQSAVHVHKLVRLEWNQPT